MSDPKDTAAVTPEATEAALAAAPVVDEVAAKLAEFSASDTTVAAVKALGVESVADLAELNEADLAGAGLPVVKARKLLAAVKPAPNVMDATVMGSAAFDGVLPGVGDDESWLKALKTGGVLKVDTSSVIAAVRAALAKRVGLYEVPGKLAAAMEAFADESEEQVDTTFYALRKQMTRRNYAEIFAAIDGLDGSFVTDKRKTELLRRIDQNLWPAIASFNTQLKGWVESWGQGFNPMMLLGLAMSGGGGVALPPGTMAPPDTSVLRDAADAVKDAVNRVFAGTGVQIAAALAYEAVEVKRTLEDTRLPALIGTANREQMLKKLGVAVPATYPRLETNLAKYVLGVMNLEDQAAGQEEIGYLSALFMLGNQIDWSQLSAGGRSVASLGQIAVGASLYNPQDYRPQDRRL